MDLTWKSASRLALVVLLLVIVTHLKGPSLWAQTQLLFDYDLGFQRRTLVGEVVSWIFPNGLTHDQIHAVAFFLSLSMILAMTGFKVSLRSLATTSVMKALPTSCDGTAFCRLRSGVARKVGVT